MLTFLRLHTLDGSPLVPHKGLLGPESLRRLAWSVYFLDATLDGGNYGFSCIEQASFTIQLPMEERLFLQHIEQTTESLEPKVDSQQRLTLPALLLRAMAARQLLASIQSRIRRRLIPLRDAQREMLVV